MKNCGKNLRLKPNSKRIDYPEDVQRIKKVCKNNGYYISKETANLVWQQYSDDLCANWITLPKDDNLILEAVLENTEEF